MFDESLTFFSHYLDDESRLNRARNDGGLDMEVDDTTPFFHNIGRGLAGKCMVMLDNKTWLQAHRYVLFNYDNIEPYLDKHMITFLLLVFEVIEKSSVCITRPFMSGLNCTWQKWAMKHLMR